MFFSADHSARRASRSLVVLTSLLAIVLISGCSGTAKDNGAADNSDAVEDGQAQLLGSETVVILKTNQGDITVRFFAEISPEHTKNFIEHSKSGLFAGTLFHRVIPGFVIQGGDPNSKDDNPANDGMGGYSYLGQGNMLNAEFNDIPHTRGILSMARSRDVNSAGSQFFVVHAESPNLNGQYTVFGEVIDGIEVVDFIVNTPRNKRDRPNEDQRIEEVVVVEWSVAEIEKKKAAMWAEDEAVNKP